MLATSRKLAIEKMKCLIQYCNTNYIKLQITKCGMMCVNGNEEEDAQPMVFEKIKIDVTKCEVYLGSAITDSVRIIDDVNEDIKLRQTSVVKYFAFLINNFYAPIDVKLKVLDACLLSSLLYNAETWADAKFERLEIVYKRMLKSTLGVGMTTCTEFLYVELGILSLKTRVMMKQWVFWNKVLNMEDSNPIIYVINLARRYNLKEVRYYDMLVERYDSVDEIVSEFYEENKMKIRTKAGSGRSKYVTYLEINPDLETPKIYHNIWSMNHVSMIAKLRTSSHNLQVEMGRRTRTARELRLCYCEKSVEDETHFLTECELYDEIRRQHRVVDISVAQILSDEKFIAFIAELFKKRKEFV